MPSESPNLSPRTLQMLEEAAKRRTLLARELSPNYEKVIVEAIGEYVRGKPEVNTTGLIAEINLGPFHGLGYVNRKPAPDNFGEPSKDNWLYFSRYDELKDQPERAIQQLATVIKVRTKMEQLGFEMDNAHVDGDYSTMLIKPVEIQNVRAEIKAVIDLWRETEEDN